VSVLLINRIPPRACTPNRCQPFIAFLASVPHLNRNGPWRPLAALHFQRACRDRAAQCQTMYMQCQGVVRPVVTLLPLSFFPKAERPARQIRCAVSACPCTAPADGRAVWSGNPAPPWQGCGKCGVSCGWCGRRFLDSRLRRLGSRPKHIGHIHTCTCMTTITFYLDTPSKATRAWGPPGPSCRKAGRQPAVELPRHPHGGGELHGARMGHRYRQEERLQQEPGSRCSGAPTGAQPH
jgi:hypothetical protein